MQYAIARSHLRSAIGGATRPAERLQTKTCSIFEVVRRGTMSRGSRSLTRFVERPLDELRARELVSADDE